jgi:diguanylate cyclase (GGDEF)-like protein/PAS domain S-box-containing protein
MSAADFPVYFREIKGERILPASDARNDRRTRGFRETYLVPNDIYSMLDAPVRVQGELAGVICAEQTGHIRKFSLNEQAFVASSADILSMSIEADGMRKVEEARKLAETNYRLLFERNLAAVFRVHLDGRLLDANEACARMFGYESRSEMLATRRFPYFDSLRRDPKLFENLRSRQSLSNLELLSTTRAGSPIWVLGSLNVMEGDSGPVVEGTLIDITARKTAEQKIEFLAFHDPLTVLPNRKLFEDRLQMAIAHARCGGPPPAVLFIDLDRFKAVNDSLGHSTGDLLLSETSKRLKRCVRGDDTVSRIGGDEFMILLQEVRQAEDAARIAQKVLTHIEEPFHLSGHQVFTTASVGASFFPGDGDSADDLIRSADSAMYRAKELGGNSYQLFSPALTEKALQRLEIESGLRRALERHSFVLHFQPQLDLNSLEVSGFEALVRWKHPTRGLVPPGEFISVAEESRLIGPLGVWILRHACLLGRQLNGPGQPGVRIGVNLSSRQFLDRTLFRVVEDALASAGLPPELLELEITESTAMEDVGATVKTLLDLRAIGVGVAMDDFGTGHSSLSYLKRLPITALKIDRSFLQEVPENPADNSIVSSVVRLAQGLGLRTVAEGVERVEQVEFLRRAGCEEGQGYLFSRPLEISAATQFASRVRGEIPI